MNEWILVGVLVVILIALGFGLLYVAFGEPDDDA